MYIEIMGKNLYDLPFTSSSNECIRIVLSWPPVAINTIYKNECTLMHIQCTCTCHAQLYTLYINTKWGSDQHNHPCALSNKRKFSALYRVRINVFIMTGQMSSQCKIWLDI